MVPAGCAIEMLRDYTVKALAHQDAKLRGVQRQVEADAILIARTNTDMNEYGRKDEVAAVDLKTNQLDASLQGLRVQLDQVMGKIDETMRRDQAYIERLGKVE